MFQPLDKYARDHALWDNFGAINCQAAVRLFESGDPFMYFPAATLGHHGLEMYLKGFLILTGMAVHHPRKVKDLDPTLGLKADDCAWGHELVELGRLLVQRTTHFKMDGRLPFCGWLTIKEPVTVEDGLAIFDPFFSELRYPQEMNLVAGIGPEHKTLLQVLVHNIQQARGSFLVAKPPQP